MSGGAKAPPERTVSSSRQFVVYGSDRNLRGVICEVAENCKRDALRLLGVRDDWRTPIVIEAESRLLPSARLAQLHVNQTGAGLKFQLDLHLAGDVNASGLEREILRAVFLELMYRAHPETPAGTPFVDPPDWLLDGALALAPERGLSDAAQALTTALAGRPWGPEEVVRQKRNLLDAPTQTLYRGYSAALISFLIEGADGRSRLARFVTDLPQAPNDPWADLVAHFPALGSDNAEVEKAWRGALVRLAGSDSFRILDCAQTERALAALLHVEVQGGKTPAAFGLEEFPRFLRDPRAQPDLQRLATALILLAPRAHPLYRPIIFDYQRIAAQLLRHKASRLPQRLAQLRATREQLIRRMSAVDDYINWFEATQTNAVSGDFRDYLRAANETTSSLPRRRDRISVYLDALEAQF
ncbi:MAG: hypothetical protein ACR2NX_03955 [Chthoniobacterales bacterium]